MFASVVAGHMMDDNSGQMVTYCSGQMTQAEQIMTHNSEWQLVTYDDT